MTKAQLISIVAKKAHLPKKAAAEAITELFNEMERNLKKGDKIVISGFGTFYVSKVDDKVVEPFGDKSKRRVVKGHRIVHFRAGKPLRKAVW